MLEMDPIVKVYDKSIELSSGLTQIYKKIEK